MSIEVGGKYIYRCKMLAAFLVNEEQCPVLHGLASHSGQVVTVTYCVPTYVENKPLFTIKAADGWRTTVLPHELEAIR